MKRPVPGTEKRMLVVALCGFCLVIWGYVVYRIARSMHVADDDSPPSVMQAPEAAALAPGVPASLLLPEAYAPDVRDPFRIPDGTLAPERSAYRSPAPRQPASPPLTLGGIVGRTVLLQRDDGAAYVARAGETAGSVRILRVQAAHAVVRYQGHTFTLALPHEDLP